MPAIHRRQQAGAAVVQEPAVEDRVKLFFVDKKRIRSAPAVQRRALAVGTDGQDRRRRFLLRRALDQRAVDPQPRIAGEDKIGFFIFTEAGHRGGANAQLRGVNIGPGGGSGGVKTNLFDKGYPTARRDVDHRATGDIQNSQADKDGIKSCHESSA